METKFGQEFHTFVMLAVLVIVVIEQLHRQAVLAQLISAVLVALLAVAYIITINEPEHDE